VTDASAVATGGWFGAHLMSCAAEAGSAVALVFEERSWTYAELDLAIRRAMACLSNLGVRRGDRVVMQGTPRPEAFIALFAATRMGAVIVPLHPKLTTSELALVCEETSPQIVIGDDPSGECPQGRTLAWDGLCAHVHTANENPPDVPRGTDVAIVAFTSGTTGRPKGVAITHDNLHWSMVNGLSALPLDDDEVSLVTTPLAHIAVLSGLPQYTWARRGTVVLAPKFIPDLFIDLVRDHRVTTAFAVPAMLAMLTQHPRFDTPDLDSLRWVLAGGAPAVPASVTRLSQRGIHVVNSYGLTESCAGVTYSSLEDTAARATSAGPPAPHVEIRIVNDRRASVPRGELGEIWLRGPSIAAHYWTQHGPQPLTDVGGWFHTGDRGRIDERGALEVLGRQKDTIITGGENVDPAEVENALADVPGVAGVAIGGTADPVWGEIVTAFVVAESQDITLDDLRRHLDGRLSRHKWPRRLHYVQALPMGATGKLQRHRLPELIDSPVSPRGTS
jgi:fatty-acyl-CoA synthase